MCSVLCQTLIIVNRNLAGTDTSPMLAPTHSLGWSTGKCSVSRAGFVALERVKIHPWTLHCFYCNLCHSYFTVEHLYSVFPSPSSFSFQMILTVYLSDGEQAVTEVPITPETTCRDVVEFCKEPGESGCHLAEVWRGNGKTHLKLSHRPAEVLNIQNRERSLSYRKQHPVRCHVKEKEQRLSLVNAWRWSNLKPHYCWARHFICMHKNFIFSNSSL